MYQGIIYRYGTFEELFAEISPSKCGIPDGEAIEEAVSRMKNYYSKEQICNYGVIGIQIELVSSKEILDELVAIKEAELNRLFPDGIKWD